MIYAIKWDEYIKIGHSIHPQERIRCLTNGIPVGDVEVLLICEGDRSLEAQAHMQVSRFRTRGEWFRDTPEVRELLDQLKAGTVEVLNW